MEISAVNDICVTYKLIIGEIHHKTLGSQCGDTENTSGIRLNISQSIDGGCLSGFNDGGIMETEPSRSGI